MRVKMTPHLTELGNGESGIHTVIRKYFQHLPEFGIELVSPDADTFDLRVSHAGMTGGDTDVAMLHGIYFTADYNAPEWEWRVNARIVEAIRSAKAVTVPSDWVAETLQRDCRFSPFVIPHGIDWKEWQHKEECQNYILWNKNRVNLDVCENSILDILIARFPDVKFVSTFPTPSLDKMPHSGWPDNFKIIETGGSTPHDIMRRYIQRAGVYLSTTKETWGLSILESLASGLPVLGWDFGGNSFLVQHGVSGYLARPGDIDDLCEGLNYCLKYRRILGDNGRELAKLWTWTDACRKVADVYRLAMQEEEATVNVVIPVFNKQDTLERAVKSVLNQTYPAKEIVIIDDGSTDGSGEIGQRLADTNDRIIYRRIQNSGVAVTRNTGIEMVSGKYISCIDSDDWVESTFLEVCVKALEQNRSLGIAYTSLRTHNSDGSSTISPWPGQFDPDKQLTYTKKQNQVSTACVFRRAAWERSGGYKSIYCPAGAGSEDAALWSAITSIGYNAKKVTDEALFNYTAHGGTVHGNREYAEIDWLEMYPWASDGQHPFASVATPKRHSHPVRQYDEPIISIIIPVGPGHEKEVTNALDSLEMQSFRKWEAVVVWDNGPTCVDDMHRLERAYPYVRSIITNQAGTGSRNGCAGAGTSRNMGASIARAPLLFFLDADDVLARPDALQMMLDAWNEQEAIIYSDYLGKAQWDYEEASKNFGADLLGYNHKQGTAIFRKRAIDFNPELAQQQPKYSGDKNNPFYHWCLVSVLIPKAWHIETGGFDESMATWEDVDYHWRQARAGHCYYRIQEPLIMYAYHKGQRREKSAVRDEDSLQQYKKMIQYIRRRYDDLEVQVCNCGKRKQVPQVTVGESASGMDDNNFVLIIFDFPGSATRGSYGQSLKSPTRQTDANGRVLDYQGYSRRKNDKFLVHIRDQQARPDMFKIAPAEVKAPKAKTEPLAEPVPIASLIEEASGGVAEMSIAKKRGRRAKVVA